MNILLRYSAATLLMFCIVLSSTVIAQTFSVTSESASVSGGTNDFLSGYITVTNLTSQDLGLRITITSKENLPDDWMTQICFFQNCYPPVVEEVEGVLSGNEADVLDLTFMTGATPGTAKVQVQVTNIANPTDFKTLTYTATATSTTSASSPAAAVFALGQNYPNPFSSGKSSITTINYTLSTTSHVSLKVFNLLGKEIRSLVNEVRPSGRHSVSWNGRDNIGKVVPPGIYMYTLTANEQSSSRRLMYTR